MTSPYQPLRLLWLIGGLLCIMLGVIGAILPLMPTTIFLIMAAYCFARSSPRLEAKLLNHPRFGPTLIAWRENGAIGRSGKAAACTGMALGFVIFWLTAHPRPWLMIVVALALAGCAAFVVTRPSPPSAAD